MTDYLRDAEEARERNIGLAYEEHRERVESPENASQRDYVTLADYRLRLVGPEGWPGFEDPVGQIGRALSEAEENISDLLPENYYVKIEEME